ncbi:competence protein CoiA family protein [Halopseudomonas sp.]|uniref:competence protein CoiA family protein n=1 Tax=Halopseudomonas sp. TaxID=2901191 RepID=UPI00356A7084
MTMTVAVDANGRVVSIIEVVRGLGCKCRCIECDETVIARKGQQRIHHFSHASQKIPCEVTPESFLHRYAKQVVKESLGLQLPPQPGHVPDSEDQSSWWDFESVKEEVWMGDFRLDLIAELSDGPLLIEFACTSFVLDEKQVRIERAGIRAIEIDLSGLCVQPSSEGMLGLKNAILHDTDLKRWLYPLAPAIDLVCESPLSFTETIVEYDRIPKFPERVRFTIQGLWVDLRVLEHGSVVLRSVAYSPLIVDLLKRLARQYSGHYVAKYRNWMFPSWARGLLQQALEALADSDNSIPAQALTLRHDEPLVNGAQLGISRYLDGRLVLKQYQTGHAPACLPTGEFRIRHFGTDLDCETLEGFFEASAVELLCVEVLQIQGQADFVYKVRR